MTGNLVLLVMLDTYENPLLNFGLVTPRYLTLDLHCVV